jgi:membrane protein involved in colicin uptake
MKKSKPYADLVTQAEDATKAIKDPELRRVAFERVLDDLLSGGGTAAPAGSRAAKSSERSTRTVKSKKSGGPKGYLLELKDDDFFKKPKTIAEVKAELANRGHHIALTSLSGPLQRLCQDRVLRRHKAKSGDKGKKVTFNYSEW